MTALQSAPIGQFAVSTPGTLLTIAAIGILVAWYLWKKGYL